MSKDSQTGYIYVVTNRVNGKQYVGQTKTSIEERWKRHLNSSSPSLLTTAMAKYGKDKFYIEEILETDDFFLNYWEERWIDKLHTYYLDPRGGGYNLTKTGRGDSNKIGIPVIIRTKEGYHEWHFDSMSEAAQYFKNRKEGIGLYDIKNALDGYITPKLKRAELVIEKDISKIKKEEKEWQKILDNL